VTRRSSRNRPGGTARDFPRTARLNNLVHEIVAEEIERLDDDRLGLLTVVAVDVEADLRHATVWYSSLSGAAPGSDAAPAPATGTTDGAEPDAELVEALEEHRPRLQSAIARQARLKRTPELSFEVDPVLQQAARVEAILREIGDDT
jgi:ribosome-binding factor A